MSQKSMSLTRREFCQSGVAVAAVAGLALPLRTTAQAVHRPVLDKQKQLVRWSFWQNRDWDWYAANVPFWESPRRQIDGNS